ncbi:MAG: glycosyltransferase [Candidatus Zixiibacteriota bacterium]
MPKSAKRIFWLGMHKVLVTTELPRLRHLGYEVFNPPYLSPIVDQSANMDWDATQYTTLPREVFEKLSRYNFFYNEIVPDIADILNSYFDVVIVTISPRWLRSVLNVYRGKVIYRTYGQHDVLSTELAREGLLLDISNRKNFIFMPHASEALAGEHSWLKRLATPVPYCLPDDIFKYEGSWHGGNGEIAVTCPNIVNPFFRAHFDFLKMEFSAPHYRYYGVQVANVSDGNIVGTLPRDEQIGRFSRSSGYLYTYTDSRVCYLPPIEMMVLGGPVLFLCGSLLDQYFDARAPGRCKSIADAKDKVQRLLNNDAAFINEIIESQDNVKERYMPEYVWPRFDREMSLAIEEERAATLWLSDEPQEYKKQRKRIYLLHHFPGEPVVFDGVEYAAYDGIPRVMRQIVRVLSESDDYEVVITARYEQADKIYGYFSSEKSSGKISVLLVNSPPDSVAAPAGEGIRSRFVRLTKKAVKKVVPARYWHYLISLKIRLAGLVGGWRVGRSDMCATQHSQQYIDLINSDPSCHSVLVPHYYCFPEALGLTKDVVLYLPDYMPHFFHETGEFRGDEGARTEIGRKIADKAAVVFCNSMFTKSYLPQSRLKVAPEKIRVFYLPLLNANECRKADDSIPHALTPGGYIFYPTQPRPNKNLALLLRVFEKMVSRGHELQLVLTSTLEADPKAFSVYSALSCKDKVVFLPQVSDGVLVSLYKNAALLCFTSLAEGNFPPQIQEALTYNTPVVASRLGFITERIPESMDGALVLCGPNDAEEFVSACEYVLKNREGILSRQGALRKAINASNSDVCFADNVRMLFR